MIHTTLGINIGSQSVHYALCTSNYPNVELLTGGDIALLIDENTDQMQALDAALDSLAQRLEPFKKQTIDAIGLALDPTKALFAHRLLPFNDPKAIDKILSQNLADIWNIDENTHIAFEVGDFVKNENERTKSENEEEESEEGYDVYVVNYPKDVLAALLEKLKLHGFDPHVAIVSGDALQFALGSVLCESDEPYALLDIGKNNAILSICSGKKVLLSRALKLGGVNIDDAIAKTFEMSLQDAENLKISSGFVAFPSSEMQTYTDYLNAQRLQPANVDPTALAHACSQPLSLLNAALRQSLIQFATKNHLEPTHLYLIGGGANLCGLDVCLSQLLGIPCSVGVPFAPSFQCNHPQIAVDALSAALSAERNIENKCAINLRRGDLSHKGSLAVIQDNKWLLASLVLLVIGSLIFMTVTKTKAIQEEHDRLKTSLEQTSTRVFGKKLMSYKQISDELENSRSYALIPEKTAFTHFAWLSTQINDNMADVEMDLNSLDIDIQRKIVTLRGEIAGNEGLPKFMQLLEQYECFTDEIPAPKTVIKNDRVAFTLRIDATQCNAGGEDE